MHVRLRLCTQVRRITNATSGSSFGHLSARAASQAPETSESRAELVIEDLERSLAAEAIAAVDRHELRLAQLTDDIDAQYREMFADRTVEVDGKEVQLSISSDKDMQKLAKAEPEVRFSH